MQTIAGHIRMRVAANDFDLPVGHLLALDYEVRHEVETLEKTAPSCRPSRGQSRAAQKRPEVTVWPLAVYFTLVILVVAGMLALFSYLRIVATLYAQPAAGDQAHEPISRRAPAAILVLAALAVILVWLEVYPAPLLVAEICPQRLLEEPVLQVLEETFRGKGFGRAGFHSVHLVVL